MELPVLHQNKSFWPQYGGEKWSAWRSASKFVQTSKFAMQVPQPVNYAFQYKGSWICCFEKSLKINLLKERFKPMLGLCLMIWKIAGSEPLTPCIPVKEMLGQASERSDMLVHSREKGCPSASLTSLVWNTFYCHTFHDIYKWGHRSHKLLHYTDIQSI